MVRRVSVTQRFGKRLRTLRVLRRLSQEELGERCNLDRTYISGIERGVRNVSLRNIEGLADGLGISMADLFDGF